jgi:8-oxo-dGTP pyrophosphatase MutT (NUDIX family)
MEHAHILSSGASDEPHHGVLRSILTKEQIRSRLPRIAATPSRTQPGRTLNVRGDHDLNQGMGAPAKLRHASVLVPLVEREHGMTVIFTQRTAHLAAHAGQISFPGGGMEELDNDAVATALRETQEEIGLEPERVEIAGRLDTYVTRTGFEITPVVGFIRPPFILNPDPFEVAEVFEVPLGFALDPANHRRDSYVRNGEQRHFYVVPYQDRYIWGATAGILVNFSRLLTG